jgi:hypothetical protein
MTLKEQDERFNQQVAHEPEFRRYALNGWEAVAVQVVFLALTSDERIQS